MTERAYALLRMHARDGETPADVVERLCETQIDVTAGTWTWSPRPVAHEVLALPM